MRTAGLLIYVGVIGIVSVARYLQISANRDKEWERRWKALPFRDRMRLAAAARRGEKVDDPNDAALTAGSARFQRQFVFNGWIIGSHISRLLVFSLLTFAGLLAHSMPLVAIGAGIVALDTWRLRRAKTRRAMLAQAEELNWPSD
jgi:hypothetical protein